MRKLAFLLAALLLLASAGVVAAIDVTMRAQSGSGQDGTVSLTPADGKTRVVIDIKPGPAGVAQPAHIHEGTCANLNPKPLFALKPVVDGKSETIVDVALSQLQSKPHAVNVHKSATEISTYVSCGDIPLAQVALPRTGGLAPVWLALAAGGLVLAGWALRARRTA